MACEQVHQILISSIVVVPAVEYAKVYMRMKNAHRSCESERVSIKNENLLHQPTLVGWLVGWSILR